MSETNFFKTVRDHRRAAQQQQSKERRDGRTHWGQFDVALERYDDTFRGVLDGRRIIDLVQEMRTKEPKPYILDVMGTGSVIHDIDEYCAVGGGAAITLTDLRTTERKQRDVEHHIDLIEGEVLNPHTWKAAQAWLQDDRHQADGFHLILARPEGALSALTNDPRVHIKLLQTLYQLTHQDGGVLLTQLPRSDRHLLRQTLLPMWEQTQGVVARYHQGVNPVLAIQRLKHSPDHLPTST